jgi:hypothetical protein
MARPTMTIYTSAASPSSPPSLPLSQNTNSRKRVAEPEEDGEHGGFGITKRRTRRIDTAEAGWGLTAGSDHAKRQNRPQSIFDSPEKENTMGYVRNVTEKVVTEGLRASLAAFGQLIYFDVNRDKVIICTALNVVVTG